MLDKILACMLCALMYAPMIPISIFLVSIYDKRQNKKKARIRRQMEIDAYHKEIQEEIKRRALVDTMRELHNERTDKVKSLEAKIDMYEHMIARAMRKEKASAKLQEA